LHDCALVLVLNGKCNDKNNKNNNNRQSVSWCGHERVKIMLLPIFLWKRDHNTRRGDAHGNSSLLAYKNFDRAPRQQRQSSSSQFFHVNNYHHHHHCYYYYYALSDEPQAADNAACRAGAQTARKSQLRQFRYYK